MPAIGMSGQKNILRCHNSGKHRGCWLKSENLGWGNAIAGVAVKTLPLGPRFVIAADHCIGIAGKLQRMQPDAAEQQRHHGEADG